MVERTLPDRATVRAYFCDLVEAKRPRQEVADWATQSILGDYDHIEVEDWVAWEMLSNLASADLMDSPSSFLFGQLDFDAWLLQFD